jgi:Ser/Thr protein kinase RdoA (MazF antagonist)
MTPTLTIPFVDSALREFGVRADAIDRLADSFNELFTVTSGKHRYVLRVGPALHVHEHDAAQEEAAWTDRLAAAGLTVPRLVRTRDGRAAVRVTDAGVDRLCTLSTWVDGDTLTRPMSATDARELGELAARLHAAAPPLSDRPAGALDGRRVLLFRLPNLLPSAADADIFAAALARAQAAIDRLWARPNPAALMHGDLTASNVVRSAGGLVPIDFQDMFWGHRELDIAYSLFSYLRHDYRTLAGAFRRGYQKYLPWPEFDAAGLPDLFAARRLMMANLALALARPGAAEYLAFQASALRSYAGRD